MLSTSRTRPKPQPISLIASALSKSKGKPQIYTHKETLENSILCAVIPFSHLRTTSKWSSKLQGPLSTTHWSWLSSLNRNWNNAFPKSTIFKSFPNFQTDLNRFFAARWLYGLSMSKRLMRLSERYVRFLLRRYKVFFLFFLPSLITSPIFHRAFPLYSPSFLYPISQHSTY